MGLPKGSRKIVVDGLAYRWYIRPRPTHNQDYGGGHLTIAIEREDTPHKTRLVVELPINRPDVWNGERPQGVVLPADVARYIREALQNGWLADQQGSPWHHDAASEPQNDLLK